MFFSLLSSFDHMYYPVYLGECLLYFIVSNRGMTKSPFLRLYLLLLVSNNSVILSGAIPFFILYTMIAIS